MRKVLKAIGTVVLLTGVICFVAQWCLGALGSRLVLRGLDWPVRNPAQAVRFPDGRYAVAATGRIQIYSASGQFQYGWQTPSFDNVLRLRSDGTLAAYAAMRRVHRWTERDYNENGVLLSSGYVDATRDELPGQLPVQVNIAHLFPSWMLFPLYGPFYAWTAALLGGLLRVATMTPEERAAARQRGRRLRGGSPP